MVERSSQYCFASFHRTRSTGFLGLSCQWDGLGSCALTNRSWVTGYLSIANELSLTECAGPSSASPWLVPIVNWPPGRKTISTPDFVTISVGASGDAD